MHEVLFDRYVVEKLIGQGAQSQVYLVADRHNQNTPKAAKVINLSTIKAGAPDHLVKEFHLLESLDHENLVRVFDCSLLLPENHPVLITEYIADAQNFDALLKSHTFALPEKIQIAFQLLNAVFYLHRKKVIHGDLKPANILIVQSTKAAGRRDIVKLIDFGVSVDQTLPAHKARVGTPYYIAPEVLKDGVIPASDLYSLGVILFRLFINRDLPYLGRSIDQIFQAHFENRTLFDPILFQSHDLPETIRRLILSLLEKDPLERPRNLALVLKQLKFEFADILQPFTFEATDARSRRSLGFEKEHVLATNFLLKPDAPVGLLLVGGESGAGKSRFLADIEERCRTEHWPIGHSDFSKKNFWKSLNVTLQQTFPHLKHSIPDLPDFEGNTWLKFGEESQRLRLVENVLTILCEIKKFVLLIDGVEETFFEHTLKFVNEVWASAKKNSKVTGEVKFVFSFYTRSLQELASEGEKSSRRIADLYQDLQQEFQNAPISKFNRADPRLPQLFRTFEFPGLMEIVLLPEWTEEILSKYLSEVFPRKDLSSGLISRLIQFGRGNPGIIQAIIRDTLEKNPGLTEPTADVLTLEGALLASAPRGFVSDSSIFKLKYYDEKARLLLAAIAGCEFISAGQLKKMFNPDGDVNLNRFIDEVLVRAFDDRLILIASEDHQIRLQSINLSGFLRQEVLEHPQPWANLMKTKTLTLDQRIKMYLFLKNFEAWSETIIAAFHQSQTLSEKLNLGDQIENAFFHIGVDSLRQVLTKKSRLTVQLLRMEFSMLKADALAAKKFGEGLLSDLAGEESEWALQLRGQASLRLGVVLRAIGGEEKKAQSAFESALASPGIDSNETIFVRGNLNLLSLAQNINQPDVVGEVDTVFLQLKEGNPVFYGILQTEWGNILRKNNQSNEALIAFEKASLSFQEAGDFVRELGVLRRSGNLYFGLGNYSGALEVFQKGFQKAESMFWIPEMATFLVHLCRSFYMVGDLRAFSSVCDRLAILCERHHLSYRMDNVFEHATLTHLEQGSVTKAMSIIDAQIRTLNDRPASERELIRLLCQGLKTAVFQRIEKWEDAKKEFQIMESLLESARSENPFLPVLKQVQLFYSMEFCRHEHGNAKALEFYWEKFFPSVTSSELHVEGVFRALQFCVASQNATHIKTLIEKCHGELVRTAFQNQIIFYANIALSHMQQNEIDLAEKALASGEGLTDRLTAYLPRARFFTVSAQLYLKQKRISEAKSYLSKAKAEFQNFTKTWNEADRENFFRQSFEYLEWQRVSDLIAAAKN